MLPRELAEAIAVRLPASEEVYGAVLPSLKHLRADENGELAPDFPGPHMRPTAPHLPTWGAEGLSLISLNSSPWDPDLGGSRYYKAGDLTKCPQALKCPLKEEPGWTGVQSRKTDFQTYSSASLCNPGLVPSLQGPQFPHWSNNKGLNKGPCTFS